MSDNNPDPDVIEEIKNAILEDEERGNEKNENENDPIPEPIDITAIATPVINAGNMLIRHFIGEKWELFEDEKRELICFGNEYLEKHSPKIQSILAKSEYTHLFLFVLFYSQNHFFAKKEEKNNDNDDSGNDGNRKNDDIEKNNNTDQNTKNHTNPV